MSKIQFDINVVHSVAIGIALNSLLVWWIEICLFYV